MLTKCIQAAMRDAHYETLDDRLFMGLLPDFKASGLMNPARKRAARNCRMYRGLHLARSIVEPQPAGGP
jgi:hypothetical protein